jgi:hypothetical protein
MVKVRGEGGLGAYSRRPIPPLLLLLLLLLLIRREEGGGWLCEKASA